MHILPLEEDDGCIGAARGLLAIPAMAIELKDGLGIALVGYGPAQTAACVRHLAVPCLENSPNTFPYLPRRKGILEAGIMFAWNAVLVTIDFRVGAVSGKKDRFGPGVYLDAIMSAVTAKLRPCVLRLWPCVD
jgi:hypothetical protein